MNTIAGEAHQMEWTEKDNAGHPVFCVTNTVITIDVEGGGSQLWFLGGAQDQPDDALDWWPLDVEFKRRERPEIEDFEREHAAFQGLLPHLVANYDGRFVAVHRGDVVDSDASREELVRRFFARFGDAPVYIGYVGRPAMAYQLTPFLI